ncbi:MULTISPECIES: NADH-quinone oxidoreductase subunit A [Thalassotalea]|uniref:NADH-quinone oxidoreductase subunit A n=1 Tax=Thalassotalea castellviae TaxID=3075612 RepID=A0ABU2ZXT0_9GAMM|nr:NADH-quinone oxidoreductase subunit A [Thalassotalea sp. W431]MDT0602738.1 NADH-quinone oxidoreductase subunit A [Thalassotalea sp. W431]
MDKSNQIDQLWPIAAYFLILAVMLAVMMLLSHFLGPKTNSRAKNTPYESGIISVSDNKTRFTSHFFLYAIFFVIFDLETIYLFAWVIAFDEVGWLGFIEASIFIIVLLVALLYIWRIGGLSLKKRHLPFRQTQFTVNSPKTAKSSHQFTDSSRGA